MKSNFERLQSASLSVKSHYITNELKSYTNSHTGDKVRHFELNENHITIELAVNVSNSSYFMDRNIIETKITYNLSNDTYKITCHGKGAKKHNYNAKRFAGYILEGMQERAGAYFVGDMSEADYMTRTYFYNLSKENNINEVSLLNELDYKLGHENMSVSNAYEWVELNSPQTEATNQLETSYQAFNRTFPTYDEAYQYCISSDFDPSYIEAIGELSSIPHLSLNAIEFHLQHFSTPSNVTIPNGKNSTCGTILKCCDISYLDSSNQKQHRPFMIYDNLDHFLKPNDIHDYTIESIYYCNKEGFNRNKPNDCIVYIEGEKPTKSNDIIVKPTRIIGTNTTVYSAWEPYTDKENHHTITHIDNSKYGQIGANDIELDLEAFPYRSYERIEAIKKHYGYHYSRAYKSILEAYPEILETEYKCSMGSIEVIS